MVTLADVLRKYGPAYVEKYGASMPAAHRKALEMLQRCRSGELGYALYRCQGCATLHAVPRSCGNRHCPTCQAHKTQQWLDQQLRLLLPCPYLLITFTVPQPLRRVIRSNQRVGYQAMFQAALAALGKLAADPRFVGACRLGLLAVLHTWGRQLDYHPHIHVLLPAGGLSEDRRQWRASRAQFFVPVEALSPIYRAKMRDALEAAGLKGQVPAAVWDSDWVVHAKPVGDGQHCLRYLARYVFRAAISNRRIVSCDHGQVVFLYRKSGSRRWRRMTLDALEFIRRFLQHVLPSGFMRVRHYGFLHSNGKPSVEEIGELIEQYYSGLVERLPAVEATPSQPPEVTCPRCGQPMRLLRVTSTRPVPLYDSG
jgi:hypothetical protein